MGDSVILLLIFADLITGFLLWLFAKDYLNRFTWWKAALLKSLLYSLFFGVGLLGEGGSEPGFLLPAPILPAAIIAGKEGDFALVMRNAGLPYACWALLLFLLFALRHLIRQKKGRRK